MSNAKSIILENLEVMQNCPARWNSMAGNEKVRFCGSCKQNVYNLSAMTEQEAENLLCQQTDKAPCVRFFRRPDGKIATADCSLAIKVVAGSRRGVAAIKLFMCIFLSTVCTAAGVHGLASLAKHLHARISASQERVFHSLGKASTRGCDSNLEKTPVDRFLQR